jgi:uncharacterized membrane protein YvlD (DUF360 family)
MKLLRGILANILICGILLFIFAWFELGMQVYINDILLNTLPIDTDMMLQLLMSFFCLGVVFRILNFPIKWIIQTLSFPVNVLTLGLFSLVINVFLLYLFARITNHYLAPEVVVQLGNLLQTLILSLIMSVGITILKKIV